MSARSKRRRRVRRRHARRAWLAWTTPDGERRSLELKGVTDVDFEVPLKPAFEGVYRLVESLKRRLDHAIIDSVFGRGQILLEDEADDVEFIPGGTPRETP